MKGLLHQGETADRITDSRYGAETWQIWYTVIRNTLFRWSMVIAAVLGVIRSIKILRPFVKIRLRYALAALIIGGKRIVLLQRILVNLLNRSQAFRNLNVAS